MKYCPRCRIALKSGYFSCPNCFGEVLDANKQELAALEQQWISQAAQEALAAQERQEQAAQEAEQKKEARQQRLARERVTKLENLRKQGAEGYWEYETLSVHDLSTGAINAAKVKETMCRMGWDGWELVTAYSNEIGRTEHGLVGTKDRLNATIGDTVLIFRRFCRFVDESQP